MQFNLRQILLATAAAAGFFAYLISNGIGIAILIAIVALIAGYCVRRIVKGWTKFGLAQRSYGVASTIAALCLLTFIVFTVATEPTLVNHRATRNLQSYLSNERRFEDTTATYRETKIKHVHLQGSVKTEADFTDLKSAVDLHGFKDLYRIGWEVTVRDTGRLYDGSEGR